ncbi:SDR family oxidoreductase [Streptomyces sp. NPDC002536]
MSISKDLFEDRKVLIVGGTSGVGLATAHAFAAARARVTVASRSLVNVERAVKELGDADATGRTLDVRDDRAVEEFAARAGEFDHVVISAAESPMPMGRADTLPPADCHAAMDSKFWGAYRVARSIGIRPMGSLTLVSGILSVRPSRASALMSAINAALEGLGRGLALERAPVRVNTVSPGILSTSALMARMSEEDRRAVRDRLPAGRVGTPEEVARAIVFLAGNAYATGTTLALDGGATIA